MAGSITVYTVCTFLLMLFLKYETDAKLTKDLLNHNAELLKNIKSYEIVKPYRLDGRKKRHSSTRLSAGHIQATTIVFPGRKKRFTLDISLNKDLFSPEFREHVVSNDNTAPVQIPHEHCFYYGTIKEEENSAVSLSTCDGIEGVIRTNDETFFIHPLKSRDGQVLDDHIIFNANDLQERRATCGHESHKTSLEREIKHKRSTVDPKNRVRRNVLNEEKFVEFFIINDYDQHRKYGNKTGKRAKELANHLDSTYRVQNIRIALVKIETWAAGDKFDVSRNATVALSNFLKYKRDKLDGDKFGKHWDNVQLLTGKDFLGTTVGYAPIQSICGKRSAAVVQDWSTQAPVSASTMAHELGHNFGMRHDDNKCFCPDEKGCVMSSFTSFAATKFSRCSIKTMKDTIKKGYGTCLFDEPKKLYGEAVCGNGFVEEGEQCDCGTEKECVYFKNTCCNSTSCMLLPGAACSHGECCDDNCQLKARGKECREKHDECDFPEYCTGESELCPEDYYAHDGISCKEDEKKDNNDGYCYKGVCRSVKLQCQYLFGDAVWAGDDKCFKRNAVGVIYNCRNDTHGEFACPKEDLRCGRIHCMSNSRSPNLIKGQDRSYRLRKSDHITYCVIPIVTHGDGVDPEYVQDGTKCGDGKMCLNSRCIPVSQAIPISAYDKCDNNCSGNGVCNNMGHCHCTSGYACPACRDFGEGGSSDSGQGCLTKSSSSGGVNVAAAVLIPIFLLLLIGAAAVIYIKRRTIRERLSHYKFVRRTTGTSSNRPPAKKSQPSVLHAGLISNPSPSDQAVQSRRAPLPPGRPTAPLMKNEQPGPTSTPQGFRGPQRPPTVPVASHQSVALFPPSAAPQEKPRPPPPTRPLAKSNLPRTPSAPPTNPNRPKLPPVQLPPNYKSTPDIPSATQPKSTPPAAQRRVPPRPKPRAPPSSRRSVPEFPEDEVPVPKPRNIGPRTGHQSVPLFNLPDNAEDGGATRPSVVKANQAKPSPPRKPRVHETEGDKRVDFRAALRPVPKPWEKI